ncbi:MAG TPA: hypothetical protein VME68_03335 [Acidobacteriaceae bacterium]|nr:hypothetical protein [Acidobacteriaceae bacterium]
MHLTSGRFVRRFASVVLVGLACHGLLFAQKDDTAARAWMRKVRIAAYPLTPDNAQQIVQQATADSVYGIEVDNDIPGRYESFLDPTVKLEAIRRVAEAAHKARNKAYVYIAGTECISLNADGPHTLAKEHPDWLQRKITGEPAIFGAKSAFWIRPGEEDVWVSPYAEPWRKIYMQRVRQIAATGIDGIYVDIPYWMTHFTGWEDTWASFDDGTVAAFKKATGLDARKDISLGDAEDPGFRKWIDFRIQTIDDFLAEIRRNAVEVNPKIALIPEIYPGLEEAVPRVGADVYQLYPIVDAIAHEYEFGEGEDHTAASRTPFDWFMYQIGMRSFRAFAGEAKPTWILNYSWDGAKDAAPREAMLSLANSELTAGANFWDARGHVMSGSNDEPTRREIFHWIAAHEDIFGAEREPQGQTGVYFSDTTRNYYPKEFVDAYRGVLLMLLRNHVQFRVVTERTLAEFHGSVLVLPDVRVVSDAEAAGVQAFAGRGGRVVLTGKIDAKLGELQGATRFPDEPELGYLQAAEKDLYHPNLSGADDLLQAMETTSDVQVEASPNVVMHEARIGGRTYLFLANFAGLEAGKNETPAMQNGIYLTALSAMGKQLHWLPFLGSETTLQGKSAGDQTTFTLPPVERGGVAWFE